MQLASEDEVNNFLLSSTRLKFTNSHIVTYVLVEAMFVGVMTKFAEMEWTNIEAHLDCSWNA